MGVSPETREPAVAGLFYPREAGALRRCIQDLLGGVKTGKAAREGPKALLAPHAGYAYSGPIAASAYALLGPLRGRVRRVVALGPSHHVAFRGLALPRARTFHTPLGPLPVDLAAVELIRDLPQVAISNAPHAREHALEVQLPFLQEALGSFTLVPLAVGDAGPAAVAEVLEALWGGPETLLVVSSDLSHYLPSPLARAQDQRTCRSIANLEPLEDPHQACGAAPVNGLLLAARNHGLSARLLDLRNSGDTAGDPDRVVGYAAFAFGPDLP